MTAANGNYSLSRLNAVKHGILSKELLLPHESAEDYAALLAALTDEFKPEGAVEPFLVEELAAIIWRKRRILAAEGAAINKALGRSLQRSRSLVNAAAPLSLHFQGSALDDDELPVREVLALSEDELARRQAAIRASHAAVAAAEEQLQAGGRGAARRALERLPDALQDLWFRREREALDVDCLGRFLRTEAAPQLANEELLLRHAGFIRKQALGASASEVDFTSIAKYEAHLDRSFERKLGVLLKLKSMKALPAEAAEIPAAPASGCISDESRS